MDGLDTHVDSAIADDVVAPEPHSRYDVARVRVRAFLSTDRGRVLLDAGWVWLITRTIFLALTFLVPSLLTSGGVSGGLRGYLDRWVTQDGYHFAYIAQHGYVPLWRTAFWPFFPMLEHILGPVFGGDYGLAGIFISNAAFFGTLVGLRSLTEREFGPEVARRTTLYLAIFPTAFYFFAPYSESLFLLLAICTFFALREHRWWLAGILGGAATFSRSAGVLLLIPFAVEFFFAWRAHLARWWQVLWAAGIPAGVGLYSGYLFLNHRDPLGYIHSQGYWGRSIQWPWETFLISLKGLGQSDAGHAFGAIHLVLNLAALTVFVVLAVLSFRYLPLSYALFVLATVLYISLFPADNPVAAVQGEGRLVLMMFPVFMLLGKWGERRVIHEALVWLMLPLLTIACAHFLLALATA